MYASHPRSVLLCAVLGGRFLESESKMHIHRMGIVVEYCWPLLNLHFLKGTCRRESMQVTEAYRMVGQSSGWVYNQPDA